MMNRGSIGWGMGFGWIYMLIFWTFAVASTVYLIKAAGRRSECGAPYESPLDILKRRYSRGEITRDEYERIKDDLKKA